MQRFLALMVTLAACAALCSPAVASDTTWTRVSTVNAANIDNELHMVLVGPRVVGAWELNTISGYSPEIIAFDPTPTRDAANLVTASQPPAADLWAFQYLTLVPDAAGNPLLVVHGTKTGATGDPTTGTSSFAVNPADGTLGPQVVHGTSLTNGGDFAAIPLAGGQLLWAYKFTSASLWLGRPGAEEFLDLTGGATPLVPGGEAFRPAFGRDAMGRYWLALYSNAPGATGLWLGQLDPATGAPLGPLAKAPGSELAANNRVDQTTLACATACRLVYQGTAASGETDGRLLSWTVGEAAPIVITTGLTHTEYWTAAYRTDGRLWVAWDGPIAEGGNAFFAKLGDANGAGGGVLSAGRPPADATGGASSLSGIAVGQNVVLAAMWAIAGKSGQFVNLVAEPPPIADGVPDPKIVSSPGGRIVAPGRVGADEVAKGCAPVRAVADKPARIWARIWTGRVRNTGAPLSAKVLMKFTKPGAKKACLKIPKRAKGFYVGKPFRIVFEVRTGAVAKPIERTRPPWKTQPPLAIDG